VAHQRAARVYEFQIVVFVDPATAALMSGAFDSALAKLRESSIVFPNEQADWARETLALRIIETVQQRGERDLERVRDDALLHLAQTKQPRD
jgi:hypothetical protein